MPPLTWNLQPDDAQAILTTLATAIRSGLAVPRPLPAVIAEGDAVPPQALAPRCPPANSATRAAHSTTASRRASQRSIGRLWGLTAALTTDPRTGLTGTSTPRRCARTCCAR